MIDDPKTLAKLGFFTEQDYRALLAFRTGDLSEADLRSEYCKTVAILTLDMTDFTLSAIEGGFLPSLDRILDTQKVCVPVFLEHNAYHIRSFADDFTAIFENLRDAVGAAFELHKRIQAFNASELSGSNPAYCCIGIGYGEVFTLGIDRAMGVEMNLSSKLGEDIATAGETLITEGVHQALVDDPAYEFEEGDPGKAPFKYYRLTKG